MTCRSFKLPPRHSEVFVNSRKKAATVLAMLMRSVFGSIWLRASRLNLNPAVETTENRPFTEENCYCEAVGIAHPPIAYFSLKNEPTAGFRLNDPMRNDESFSYLASDLLMFGKMREPKRDLKESGHFCPLKE